MTLPKPFASLRFAFAAALCAMGAALVAAPTADDPFRPDLAFADGAFTATFFMERPDQHIYDDMLACSLGEPAAKPAAPAAKSAAPVQAEAKPAENSDKKEAANE